MDRKPSEHIADFLDFIREAPVEYNIAQSRESDADKETQDILHWIEFYGREPENTGHSAKVQEALGEIRQRRRDAKNAAEILGPVAAWAEENGKTIKSLKQLLGEVRKVEKNTQNRSYMDRTDIMAEILGVEAL